MVFDDFPKEVKRFRRALFLEEFILFEYLMTCSIWLQVAVFEKGRLGRWQPTTQPPMPSRLVPPRQPINGNRKTNKQTKKTTKKHHYTATAKAIVVDQMYGNQNSSREAEGISLPQSLLSK